MVLIGKGKWTEPSSSLMAPQSVTRVREYLRQQAAQKQDCLDKGNGARSQETDGKVVIYSSCYLCLFSLLQSKGVCNERWGKSL